MSYSSFIWAGQGQGLEALSKELKEVEEYTIKSWSLGISDCKESTPTAEAFGEDSSVGAHDDKNTWGLESDRPVLSPFFATYWLCGLSFCNLGSLIPVWKAH